MSGHWIDKATDSDWTSENAIINGRRIYSFRAGAGALLDYYDIPSNSWVAVTYAPATETFTTGTKWASSGNFIYCQKDATGRWFRYDVTKNDQDGWSTMLYPNSTPEFRILVKQDNTQEFQIRYINITQGYVGKWQPIQVIYEQEQG